jgi:hypothetical protein
MSIFCIKCQRLMEFVRVNDTGTGEATDGGKYAFKLYVCEKCMIVARENVWDNKGIIWIYPDQMPVDQTPATEKFIDQLKTNEAAFDYQIRKINENIDNMIKIIIKNCDDKINNLKNRLEIIEKEINSKINTSLDDSESEEETETEFLLRLSGTPPIEYLLQFFEYSHLKPELQQYSKPFYDLAHSIVNTVPKNKARKMVLEYLVQAKDWCVRARLSK